MKERLFGVGLVGLIVLFVAGRAATNHKSSVLDILGKTEAKATVEVPPIETVDPVEELEQKFEQKLDARIKSLDELYASTERCQDLEAKIDIVAARNRDLSSFYSDVMERMLKLNDSVERSLTQQESLLGSLKQSEQPSKAPEKTQLAKELTFVYGDGCQPCDQWKIGPDREKIAAECHIVPVYVGDLPPESRPESLPAYTLQVDGLRARHRGYLTFQRFKDMERAILEKRRSQ